MSSRMRPAVSRLLPLAFCLLALAAPAAAQRPEERGDTTVEALLEEVRLLRETLQRVTLNTYRGQIIFERLRAQNERVTRLGRTLEDTRDELADLGANLKRLGERAEALEGQAEREVDQKQRAQLEAEQRELEYALEQFRQRHDRLQAREAQLTAELQAEQARLSDMEGRLEALEREIENEIERQRAADAERRRPR